MNKPGGFHAAFLAKGLASSAILISLFASPGSAPRAQSPDRNWKLKEIRVFTKLSGHSAVVRETYDKSGGTVEINVDGRALDACPGGAERMMFEWRFSGDMASLSNGGAFQVSLAGNHSETGACAGKRPYSALSSMAIRGNKGLKSALSDEENQFIDPERFFNTEDRNYYVYASESQTRTSTRIALSDYPSSPKFHLAYFEVQIGTRAGDLIRYVYVYDSGSGGGPGGGGPGGGSAGGVGPGGGANGGGDGGHAQPGGAIWGATNSNAGLNGTTLVAYAGTTPEQCQADCGNNPDCKGFTFIRAGAYNPGDPAMCYQMSEATSFVPSPCCISAIKDGGGHASGGAQAVGFTIEYDTDRRGGDYKDFDLPQPDLELCRAACADDPNCRAFTYVKPGGQGANARCWLKSSVPDGAGGLSCCISGVKN